MAMSPTPIRRLTESIAFRAFTLAFLSILLLIPLLSVRGLVNERKALRRDAAASIAAGWGGPQTILGPVLVLQAKCFAKPDKDGHIEESRRLAVKLPQALTVEGEASSEIRRRGLHEVPVYRVMLAIALNLEPPSLAELDWQCAKTELEAASIAFAVSDPRGIDRVSPLSYAGSNASWHAGTPLSGPWQSGVQAAIPIADLYPSSGGIPMRFELELRGSDRFALSPAGGSTELNLRADWSSPSFDGAFLPSERSVQARGFEATWKVSELARPVPSLWLCDCPADLAASAFGVTWFQPADGYLTTERSLKYGFLFIALTFLTFFLFELGGSRRAHPIQYGLVGGAICVFYLLLLSLSERTGFGVAYLVAAVATTTQITLYGRAFLRAGRRVAVLGAVLATLYGGLYLLVGLEEIALLLGSIALFLIIAIAMWVTRTVNGETLPARGLAPSDV